MPYRMQFHFPFSIEGGFGNEEVYAWYKFNPSCIFSTLSILCRLMKCFIVHKAAKWRIQAAIYCFFHVMD